MPVASAMPAAAIVRAIDIVGCLSGLAISIASCAKWLCGDRWRPAPAAQVGPVIRQRILSRKLSGNGVDIHTLLVRPDPGRSVKKSYKILGTLGKGGFGSVHRVLYLPTGEERAIKIIHKPKDPVEQQRVLTEVELLIQLDHPGIEKFFEFFEDPKLICLVTELCTGGNLGEIDPTEDSDQDIRLLFRDIVSAVAYCHSMGVVHRDLKFENVLLTELDEGTQRHLRRFAKVIDFGLSSVRPEGEQADRWMDEAVGTVYFIAPEVLKSEGAWTQKYGPKSDVWSIGVMLYIVLTDQHPFARSAASTTTILSRIRKEAVRTSPLDEAGVDPSARELVMGLLAKDPAKRLTAEKALHHSFFAVNRGMSSPCSPLMQSPRTQMRSMMPRICSFAHFSRFERAMLTLVAHESQAQEVHDLRNAFLAFDTTRAGWLTSDDVRKALSARGIKLPKEDLEAAFEALDPDKDDKIQYTDWLAATLPPSTLATEKAMKELFDFFDIDGSGKVSQANLVEVLGDDALDLPEDLAVDKNGEISWEQFQRIIPRVARNMQAQVDARVRSSKNKEHRWWLLRGQNSTPALRNS